MANPAPFSFARAKTYITPGGGSARFSSITAAVTKMLESFQQEFVERGVKVVVLPLSGPFVNTVALLASTIDGANAHVFYNVLTPEGPIADIKATSPTQGQATITGTAENVVDSALTSALDTSVMRLGAQHVTGAIHPVGHVIWAHADGNDPSLMESLIASLNYLLPVVTDPTGSNGSTLVNFDPNDMIVANVANGQQGFVDSSGYPASSQMTVRVTSESRTGGVSQNTAGTVQIASGSIVVDYVRVDSVDAPTPGIPARRYAYAPRSLITLNTPAPAELPVALLNLAVHIAATANNAWRMPTLANNPCHDIGWLPAVAGQSQYVAGLNGMAVDQAQVSQVLDTLVNPGYLIQTLVIGQSTTSDLMLAPFVESSRGDANADGQIRRAMKALTGVDYAGPITLRTGSDLFSADVVPAGYFDDRGSREDFAPFLTLPAIAAKLQGSVPDIETYLRHRVIPSMTTASATIDGVTRLVYLQNAIRSLYASRAPQFTGIKRLVTLTGGFTEALLGAIRQTAGEPDMRVTNAFLAQGGNQWTSPTIAAAFSSSTLGLGQRSGPGGFTIGRQVGRRVF